MLKATLRAAVHGLLAAAVPILLGLAFLAARHQLTLNDLFPW
ncbi:MAG: hypothetical protein NZ750_08005 [Anaerolineae bacterium]|nr:hypothetical protein [Anaerolineae bacterium]MDW8172292.1 hypothetical protein [Anaerolineae bacterium]